jgi:transcriptional regulator with XRE-family HTH domain
MPPRKRADKNTPLYRWRHAVQLTLEQAAARFGVSTSTYRRLEAMKTLPKRYSLAFDSIRKQG